MHVSEDKKQAKPPQNQEKAGSSEENVGKIRKSNQVMIMWRHYRALNKKNWIIWRRNVVSSILELILPVLLMYILVYIKDRLRISRPKDQSESTLKYGNVIMPIVNPMATGKSLMESYAEFRTEHEPFFNFTAQEFDTGTMLHRLDLGRCGATPDIDARRYFAIAPKDNDVAAAIGRDIELYYFIAQNLNKVHGGILDNDKDKDGRADFVIKIPHGMYMKPKYFKSLETFQNYYTSAKYEKDEKYPGICFGVSLVKHADDDYEIKMHFDDTPPIMGETQNLIPNQREKAVDEFNNVPEQQAYLFYVRNGYVWIHNWAANAVLREATGNQQATIVVSLVPFKSDTLVKDEFTVVLDNVFPLFVLLMYVMPLYRTIYAMVHEKESMIRESMKMMGLSETAYYLSWLTYYMGVVMMVSLGSLYMLYGNVLEYSDPKLLYLFFCTFGLSTFGYVVIVQAFFQNPRIASITGTLIFFGSSFFDFLLRDKAISLTIKRFGSLLGTIAVSRGASILSVFESSRIGLQNSNYDQLYGNYKMSACIEMMVLGFIILTLIGVYIDLVLPGGYGQKLPWNFFFHPSYWFGSKKQKKIQKQSEIDPNFELKTIKDKINYEPVNPSLNKQEMEREILKIEGLKKTYDNGFEAVKGVNLKMYNGQIFALLGHNGAGKTTTISMLTGLIEKTQGSAEVFGHDMFTEMSTVREQLGVCPQHNILFDYLTPREHLEIFCEFKGVDADEVDDEIDEMIEDVDLEHNQDSLAKDLSGGNMRKLSVAIALIGGSRLVILDEPTSGLDLNARRKLWNMLRNYKQNRIIILTTHYMDEADILGDRIGIMSNGQVICIGTSLFLKNRFGVGYNLTMVKKSKESNKQVEAYLKQKLGEVSKLSEVSSEISFQIPLNLSPKFKSFFDQFDKEMDKLDIRSYGISITTLEEVFLRVGDTDGSVSYQDRQKIKNELKEIQEQHEEKGLDEYSVSESAESGILRIFSAHMVALFRKRFLLYTRNMKMLMVELVIPVFLVLIGLLLSKVKLHYDSPQRDLTTSLMPLKQRILVNDKLVVTSDNDIEPRKLMEFLPNYKEAFEPTFRDYSHINLTVKQSAIIEQFEKDVYENRNAGPSEPYRYGSFYVYEANNDTKQFRIVNFINLTGQDTPALYPQFIYEAVIRAATGNPNFKFKVSTSPFPIPEKIKEREVTANGIFLVFVISIGFALIPACIISYILSEHVNGLKHMQLISGMNLTSYWVSNYIFDLVKVYIPVLIIIGMLEVANFHFNYVWMIFLLYPLAIVPFTYVTSFMLQSENFAQTLTVFIHFSVSGAGTILVFFLRLMRKTKYMGDTALYVLRFLPSFCLTNSIMFQSSKEKLWEIRYDLSENEFHPDNIGGDFIALILHIVIWNLALLFIETDLFESLNKFYCGFEITPKQNLVLDDDVIEEAQRVAQTDPNDMKIRVHKLRKVYTAFCRRPFLAVERVSFGLDYGECFTLLGVNGAGKTTTFKSLTNDIQPTSGKITINGLDVRSDFHKVRKLIGFCPQHNALFDTLTVMEHLEYYAIIKNIKKDKRKLLIEQQIKQMNLQEHRNKLAGTLSGGNKRKLCVAMAVLGNPPIILLDEPSSGMDPEAKRFMWSVVAQISQHRKKSAVILTTHSMEEAEALSTKMGIMVKGGIFRCFGSSQHIKSKYGTGYEIEIKIKKQSDDELNQLIHKLGMSEQETINIPGMKKMILENGVDAFLTEQFKIDGLAEELYTEASEHQEGEVQVKNFVNWLYVQQQGLKVIKMLVEPFKEVELLEYFNDYFKLRVPRQDKSIGFAFGLIEDKKESLGISEYSVGQTTLEQIFQTFANLENDEVKDYVFVKNSQGKVVPVKRNPISDSDLDDVEDKKTK